MLKIACCALMALLLGCATAALAADSVEPAGCSLSSVVQGGGMITKFKHKVSIGDYRRNTPYDTMQSGFGEVAADLQCATWTFQADAAFYSFTTNGTYIFDNYDMAVYQGHIGGAIFNRKDDLGMIGLSGSRVLHHQKIDFVSPFNGIDIDYRDGAGYWRVGGFGEFYAGDALTLGAGAYYINGDWLKFGKSDNHFTEKGLEAFATLKYYPMDELAINLRGDILNSKIKGGEPFKFTGYALSAEAEYLVRDTHLSFFAGARYADRTLKSDFTKYSIVDKQAFLGLRFTFGGPVSSSLGNRDRHGSYDNTSVFLEKLPTGAVANERVFLSSELIE